MRKIDRKGLRLVVWTLGSGVGLFVLAAGLRLRVNRTASFPVGIYRLSKGWAPGDLVLIKVVADRESLRLAEARGYVREIEGRDGVISLIKRVVAVEGDRVDVACTVHVNGRELAKSAIRDADSVGRPLPHEAKSGVVPAGKVWVMSDYSEKSFDSRYFGAVPASAIEGRVNPVLTW